VACSKKTSRNHCGAVTICLGTSVETGESLGP